MSTSPRTRRSAKEWKKLIAAWQRSGMTLKAFAAREDLSPSTLGWWRWRLASEEGATTTLVPVTVVEDEAVGGRRVEGESRWELRVGQDLSISMTGPAAVEGLAATLRALEWSGR